MIRNPIYLEVLAQKNFISIMDLVVICFLYSSLLARGRTRSFAFNNFIVFKNFLVMGSDAIIVFQ